jgi:hypothetical protein
MNKINALALAREPDPRRRTAARRLGGGVVVGLLAMTNKARQAIEAELAIVARELGQDTAEQMRRWVAQGESLRVERDPVTRRTRLIKADR